MSTITFVLVLMAILFFVGIVGSFLLLLLIGKITAHRGLKDDKREKK